MREKAVPASRQGFATVFIVILMVILAAAVLGVIYYYTEIYQPKQYTQEAISIHKDFQVGLVEIGSSPFVPAQSPSEIVQLAQRHKDVVERTREKLNKLKPPRKMKQVHGNFLTLLDVLNTLVSEMTALASSIESSLASGGRPDKSLEDIQRNLEDIQEEVRRRADLVEEEFRQLKELYGR